MAERHGVVTFQGTPLTLVGPALAVGDDAPNVTLLDTELNEVELSSYKGKTVLLISVPSLDTGVCDKEARTFNEKVTALGDDVVLLTISMDLPFAQDRWCGAAGIDNAITLSDHRDAAFGNDWGVLIKELRLLARAVFVVDKAGDIRYIELVPEMTDEPNYQAALDAVDQARS